MTTQHTPHRARRSSENTVLFHRFHRVLRTRGSETAGRRQERRDPTLVSAQNADDHLLHRDSYCAASVANNRRTSSSIRTRGASKRFRRGLSTTSQPGARSACCNRTTSRKRRRMRFLTTLLPSARGVVNPTRDAPELFGNTNAVNKGEPTRRPVEYTRSKSARCNKRDVFGQANLELRGPAEMANPGSPVLPSGVCDLSRGVAKVPCGRPVFSYACETRVSSRDGAAWAEKSSWA